MRYHKVRMGELENLEQSHPVIAAQGAGLASPAVSCDAADDPDFPTLFYGEEEGQLACYLRSFPDVLRLEGRDVPWAWNCNLMTFPAFRRRGLAQALVAQQLEHFGASGHVWGGVFSAVPALRLYEKLGFTMTGYAPRLCVVRNTTPFLGHHMPDVAARVAGAAGRVAAAGLDRVLRFRQPWRGAL